MARSMAPRRTRRLRDALVFSFFPAFFAFVTACPPAPAPVPPPAASTADAGPSHTPATITLVESVPSETTLDHPAVPNAPEVWRRMVEHATTSIDLAEFYASEAETDAERATSKLAPILDAIEASMKRGVKVRFLADALFAKQYPQILERLAKAGAAVRQIDVQKLSGGVHHAKYFVVDGTDAYLGSQNFDWRALDHIFEMGVRVQSASFAGALEDVFDTDWALAGGAPKEERVHRHPRAADVDAGANGHLAFVASPRGWLPHEEDWDLPRIIAAIDEAKTNVHVEVLLYKTKARNGSPFHDLDDALRRAQARGVTIALLVSDWATKPGSDSRRDLDALAILPHVAVKEIRIPKHSSGDIPFARVAHAKFMIVDGRIAWIGTSNWEGDYFFATRNVGVIVTGGALPKALDEVFVANWDSPYTTMLANVVATPPATTSAPPPPPPPPAKGCPKTAQPNAPCAEPGRECTFGPKTSCMCLTSPCATPAGPTPNCKPEDRWTCRDDGCPVSPRGACRTPGQQCTSDDGFCAQEHVCTGGRWTPIGHPSCRPAAPPRP